MAKQNTKAGATQLQQDMTAAQAAQDQQAPAQESTNEQATQQVSGDVAGQQEAGQGTQEAAQESASQDSAKAEEKDLIIEPKAPVVAAPAPAPAPAIKVTSVAAAPKAVVVEASKPVAANHTLTEKLALILKDVPATYQTDIGRILTYLERMAPKRPVDMKVGVVEQVALYKSIQNIINRQEQYFTQLFSALLCIFQHEFNGALGDRYRLRFMENVTLPVGDRKGFSNLTTMLHILADEKSRTAAKSQINMERALENGLTADGRNRVMAYFNL